MKWRNFTVSYLCKIHIYVHNTFITFIFLFENRLCCVFLFLVLPFGSSGRGSHLSNHQRVRKNILYCSYIHAHVYIHIHCHSYRETYTIAIKKLTPRNIFQIQEWATDAAESHGDSTLSVKVVRYVLYVCMYVCMYVWTASCWLVCMFFVFFFAFLLFTIW